MPSQLPDKNEPALTDEDYYLTEEGYLVFTEAYHRKRGYCCQNGCRHCLYGFKKRKNELQIMNYLANFAPSYGKRVR
ncbi:DUF5522 domain-containing protein [Spirosoma sp. KNUC1025]|uniref:DUF5522 domain-containing protein n=1 Tax=Spirosoma sp. KNUC1025 TaxID=2894082 RepID=UPI003865B513|nr:DUF5522 domain-containing protein [Spirosoma sp. KNUC1025]